MDLISKKSSSIQVNTNYDAKHYKTVNPEPFVDDRASPGLFAIGIEHPEILGDEDVEKVNVEIYDTKPSPPKRNENISPVRTITKNNIKELS
jgi:hypothetical protein